MPIISFQIWQIGQKTTQAFLVSPQPPRQQNILGISIQNQGRFPAFISTLTRDQRSNYDQFSITVPRLKLSQEKVLVDNNDLSRGLSHLPGSALPGEKGNVFISGHSAVSPFVRNAYFAKLQDLKKGDRIEIEAEGANFTYQVVEIKVVDPTNLSVIAPPEPQGRYLSLMTCIPPGLNLKRLIVLGKMI